MNKQLSKHIRSGGLDIKIKNQGDVKPNNYMSPMSAEYKKYLQNNPIQKVSKPVSIEHKTSKKELDKKELDKKELAKKELAKKEKGEKKIKIERKSPHINDPTIKIIRQKENKSKHKFTRKKPIMDI